jgi:PPOX class probable FMN-dependent enzyme
MKTPDSKFEIKSEADLRSIYADTHPLAIKKCLPLIDRHCRDFIARSPFLCLSTQHANGMADVSPRGDPPGFVRVLDEHTLAIPDRPGNNRLDSLSNILSNPSIALLFLVPGFEDALRVNGTASLNRDPMLLQSMSVKGRVPTLAIVVTVHEAFLHCAKALRRAKIWKAESHQNRSEMTSMIAMVMEHSSGEPAKPDVLSMAEQDLEQEYKDTLY